MARPAAILFDADWTVLNPVIAVARLEPRLGMPAPRFVGLWRAKLLEYQWVRALTGPSQYFEQAESVAQALDYCLRHLGREDAVLRCQLLACWQQPPCQPEFPEVLRFLRQARIPVGVLSDRTSEALEQACQVCGIADHLDLLLSAAQVGAVYRPEARVYRWGAEAVGRTAGEIVYVAAESWDAQAARAAGFRVVWVNREAAPVEYGLRDGVPQLPDLAGLPALLSRSMRFA